MALVGREDDLKMLEQLKKTAKTAGDHRRVREAMQAFDREDKNKKVAELRHALINATKANDLQAIENISGLLTQESRR